MASPFARALKTQFLLIDLESLSRQLPLCFSRYDANNFCVRRKNDPTPRFCLRRDEKNVRGTADNRSRRDWHFEKRDSSTGRLSLSLSLSLSRGEGIYLLTRSNVFHRFWCFNEQTQGAGEEDHLVRGKNPMLSVVCIPEANGRPVPVRWS